MEVKLNIQTNNFNMLLQYLKSMI